MENHHDSQVNQLSMAIFNSYGKLPEGSLWIIDDHWGFVLQVMTTSDRSWHVSQSGLVLAGSMVAPLEAAPCF